jgi:hypothetical protein
MAEAAPAVPEAPADPQEARRQQRCAQRWIAELQISEKAQAKWLQRAKKIVRLYEYTKSDDPARKRQFAMLWANTQTIQPAVYSRAPAPVVSRRFKDEDPTGRIASEVLERALAYSSDVQDLDGVFRQTSFDFVLLARGQTWERYVPTHGPAVTPQIALQVVTSGDEGEEPSYEDEEGNAYEGDVSFDDQGNPYGQGEPYEPVIFEESVTDYVNWEDFGHSVSRTWDEVSYVWRRVYLSREQLEERFGEALGKLIPLDWGPVQQGHRDTTTQYQQKAAIYEIWSKADKKVYWISKSWNSRPLDERDDPLGLEGFFPCPRPLLGTTGNDTCIPTPDYVYYQDQAEEIDKLTARIAVLQDAIKVRGFYASQQTVNLNNLLNSDNNILIPVPDWVTMKEGGGVRGNIEWFPIDQVVEALQALLTQRAQLISDVYQITGVSDIQRGESDPRETMGAQKIKASFGSLRVRDRQIEMARFCRDVLRIKGHVIAEKFSADTLRAMTGVQLPTDAEKQQAELQVQQMMLQAQAAQQAQAPPQPGQPSQARPPGIGHNGAPPMPQVPEQLQAVLQSPSWEDVEALLHNDAARSFRIDIETDSTIEPNEQEEKQRTTELLTALGNLIQQWGPAIAAQPALAPMVGGLIKFALRRFRAGRELEDLIDGTIDKIVQQASQAAPPGAAAHPPPDQTPVQVAAINQQTEQITQAGETQRTQIEAGIRAQELQVQQQDQQLHAIALARDPNPQAIQ